MLLLPTEIYVSAGVAVVALTILALFALPDGVTRAMFSHRTRPPREIPRLATFTSVLMFVLLAMLVAVGIAGPRDPLSNIMPLSFWTLGWVGMVSLSGLVGGLWHWLNPWTGLYTWLAPG